MLDISSTVYQIFYKIFRDKFIAENYTEKTFKGIGIGSPKIWDKQNVDKEYISLVLFRGDRVGDHRYFYRKHHELVPKNKASGTIDELAFFKGLQYIGIKPPIENNDWQHLQVPEKVRILYEVFIKEHAGEIKLLNYKHEKSSAVNQADLLNIIYSDDPSDTLGSNLTAAKFLLQRFYENIACSNILEAWALMSTEFQNRRPWYGDFEKFKNGYINTNGIRNIVVFSVVQNTPNVIDCKVFYDDDIAAWTNKELASLDALTVGDLDTFIDRINKMKSDFANKGLNGFEDIELAKLFEPSASEYIWYRCGFDSANLDKLFSTQKSLIVKRVYDCSCILSNGKWLINSINAMKTYSAR